MTNIKWAINLIRELVDYIKHIEYNQKIDKTINDTEWGTESTGPGSRPKTKYNKLYY